MNEPGEGNLSILPSESQVMSARVAGSVGSSSSRWIGMIGNSWSIAQISGADLNTAFQSHLFLPLYAWLWQCLHYELDAFHSDSHHPCDATLSNKANALGHKHFTASTFVPLEDANMAFTASAWAKSMQSSSRLWLTKCESNCCSIKVPGKIAFIGLLHNAEARGHEDTHCIILSHKKERDKAFGSN